MMKMAEYNVYYHEVNGNKIKTFNVLSENGVIHNFIKKCRKKDMSKEEFNDVLKRECMYWYWCKCEWEVVIKEWVGKEVEKKIDVFQQLEINWNVFSEICWKLYMGE